MADVDEQAVARLAFWARGGSKMHHRDAERARLALLAETVDRRSYRRYVSIRAALCIAILMVGITIILLLAEFAPWAAVKIGLIDPLVLADNVALLLVMLALAAAGALAVTIAGVLISQRLAAAWSAGAALRARLVPQPGDAALLAQCEREAVRPMLLGLPVIAVIMLMLVWLAMSDWLPKTEWLILTGLILSVPLVVLSLRRMVGRKLKLQQPR